MRRTTAAAAMKAMACALSPLLRAEEKRIDLSAMARTILKRL